LEKINSIIKVKSGNAAEKTTKPTQVVQTTKPKIITLEQKTLEQKPVVQKSVESSEPVLKNGTDSSDELKFLQLKVQALELQNENLKSKYSVLFIISLFVFAPSDGHPQSSDINSLQPY